MLPQEINLMKYVGYDFEKFAVVLNDLSYLSHFHLKLRKKRAVNSIVSKLT